MMICKPNSQAYGLACELLARDELCAFPTETVYGLGGNALSDKAVLAIYKAKGRPSTNPLIVHVHSIDMALPLVEKFPPVVVRLMELFWPGPLTFVLPATDKISILARAGGNTVGLRMPKRPVALELIRRSGFPLAAPSANRSGHISPTLAVHVAKSLPQVPLILDDGPCEFGIESTVVSLLPNQRPKVLRLGALPYVAIKEQLPELEPFNAVQINEYNPPAPGMSRRHYAPLIPSILVEQEQLRFLQPRIGVLTYGKIPLGNEENHHVCERLPEDPVGYASGLYQALYRLEAQPIDALWIVKPPITAHWLAVWDRLIRATSPQ